MKPNVLAGLSLAGVTMLSGCRAATRVADVPRVDLELSSESGNRGYLVGTPPEPVSVKPTRQVVTTDIEIPSFYKPKHLDTQVTLDSAASSGTETIQETNTAEAPIGLFDTYVVQKGESLWSIAAKPQVYGKATKWRRIFDANRELLKTPDRVRVGMKLKIPRDQAASESRTTHTDGKSNFRK